MVQFTNVLYGLLASQVAAPLLLKDDGTVPHHLEAIIYVVDRCARFFIGHTVFAIHEREDVVVLP
jgi:hypothetical protein